MAYRRIGDWPDTVGRAGLAREHAWMAWINARSGVVARADGLWTHVGAEERPFLGQVDLAFLGTLAGHLRRCEDCWKNWSGERPGELLTRAVRKRPMGAVFTALVTEIREGR
jgi:hypothetical protein